MSSVREVSVTGASSFIGGHLVAALERRGDIRVNALAHEAPVATSKSDRIRIVRGDLRELRTLNSFMGEGSTVVHLAYLTEATPRANIEVASNIADLCVRKKVKRFIHCSTAMVVGRCADDVVDEQSPCCPTGDYEQTKFDIENLLLERSLNRFEMVILRPTAVFGPGGRNLLKLADGLARGRRWGNYVRSCIVGTRAMNLVWIDNVVAALLFCITADRTVDRNIFIVSDDDCEANHYRFVEKELIRYMGLRNYGIPFVPFPRMILRTALLMMGRSNVNPYRLYTCRKLMSYGFRPAVSFEEGLARFSEWYMKRNELENRRGECHEHRGERLSLRQ